MYNDHITELVMIAFHPVVRCNDLLSVVYAVVDSYAINSTHILCDCVWFLIKARVMYHSMMVDMLA